MAESRLLFSNNIKRSIRQFFVVVTGKSLNVMTVEHDYDMNSQTSNWVSMESVSMNTDKLLIRVLKYEC